MEDDFDLEVFIKKQEKQTWYKTFHEKNQKLISALKVMIVVFAFVIAYLSYTVISYYLEVWRNNTITQRAHEVNMLAQSAESSSRAYAESMTPPPSEEARENEIPFLAEAAESKTAPPITELVMNLRNTFKNDDIVGYLKIEGTKIDFPVVQGPDNSYYLTRDLTGKDNVSGAAFMDAANDSLNLGFNTILYAHNMRDGSMFHDLRNYVDKAYYNTHSTIKFTTLLEETEWEIFSFYETTVDFNYIRTSFDSADEFNEFILSPVKERSFYDTGVEVDKNDRVLTLSTCTNRIDDTRFVVHAKLSGQE
jgi:SrtB family sortase